MQVFSVCFFNNNYNVVQRNKSCLVPFLGGLEQDKVEFSKKEVSEEEKLCQKLIQQLYGDYALYLPNRQDSFLKRFDVRSKNLHNHIADGVFIYDKNNKFQYITIQENDKTNLDIGAIKVFDTKGKLIKHLAPIQAKILRHYRGNLATILNSLLRHGQENNPLYKDDFVALDSIFADENIPTVISSPRKVYRGVDINQYNFDFFKKNIVRGNIMREKGYMSTSANRDIASNDGNFLFEIDVPKGKKYLDMHTLVSPSEFYIDEQELLFNRNTNLLIKDFDNEKHIIYAQML